MREFVVSHLEDRVIQQQAVYAQTLEEARRIAFSRGLDVLKVAAVSSRGIPFRASVQDQLTVLRQFDVALRSGVSAGTALQNAVHAAEGPIANRLRPALAAIRGGKDIPEALTATGVFDAVSLSLLSTGDLISGVNRAISYLSERKAEAPWAKRIVAATKANMFTLLSAGYMLTQGPELLEKLNAKLSPAATAYVHLGEMLGWVSFVTPILMMLVLYTIMFQFRFRPLQSAASLKAIPGLHSILFGGALASVFSVLRYMLESGQPITVALARARGVSKAPIIHMYLDQVSAALNEGVSTAPALARDVLPLQVRQTIAASPNTKKLAENCALVVESLRVSVESGWSTFVKTVLYAFWGSVAVMAGSVGAYMLVFSTLGSEALNNAF